MFWSFKLEATLLFRHSKQMGFPRFCGSSLEGNVRPWRNLARFLSQALDDYKNPNREGKRESQLLALMYKELAEQISINGNRFQRLMKMINEISWDCRVKRLRLTVRLHTMWWGMTRDTVYLQRIRRFTSKLLVTNSPSEIAIHH